MRIKDLDSTGNLFQILSLYLFLNKLQLSARIPPNKYKYECMLLLSVSFYC